MLIENRKTLKRYEITNQDWQKILDLHLKNLYRVIDKSTLPASVRVEKVNIPSQITEFKITAPKKIEVQKQEEKQTKKPKKKV